MKKYKLYIFDLDGTLLDSDQMIIETFHELHKMYSLADFVPDDNVLITYSGPPIRESLKNEFPELDQEEILKVWRERSLKNYPKYTRLFPNVIETLTMLKNEGAKIAIVTNKNKTATLEALRLFGLNKLDIYSVTGDDVCDLKPSPEGIHKAMHHFRVSEKLTIYIGDSKYDVETAKNAHVDFALASWTPRKLSKDAKIAWKIDSFFDLLR